MIKRLGLLFLITVFGCVPASKEELVALDKLNKAANPDYEFFHFDHIEEVYFKMKMNKARIDSIEMADLYDKAMSLKMDPSGKEKIHWLYMIVYDSNDKYLCTVRKYDSGLTFFRDAIF